MTEAGLAGLKGPAAGRARRAAAERIAACCHLLAREGLVSGFGHVSERVGLDAFLISGKVPLHAISPGEVVLVEGMQPEQQGAELAPVETVLHAAVYRTRPDVGAIARTHGEYGSVLSILGEPLRPVHGFGATLGPEVPVYDTCELVEDERQGARLAATLGGASAVLLRGNGQLVCGADLVEACVLACHLEESARLAQRARSARGSSRFRSLTGEEAAAAAANLGSRPQLARAFSALCQRHGVAWPGGGL